MFWSTFFACCLAILSSGAIATLLEFVLKKISLYFVKKKISKNIDILGGNENEC